MTESEAIEMLQDWNKDLALMEDEAQGIECHELAIKALEKQIPKKIVKHDKCPACNNGQSTTWYYVGASYCEYCGQKLNWSDEE